MLTLAINVVIDSLLNCMQYLRICIMEHLECKQLCSNYITESKTQLYIVPPLVTFLSISVYTEICIGYIYRERIQQVNISKKAKQCILWRMLSACYNWQVEEIWQVIILMGLEIFWFITPHVTDILCKQNSHPYPTCQLLAGVKPH